MPIKLDGKVIYLPGEKQPKKAKEELVEIKETENESLIENAELEQDAIL